MPVMFWVFGRFLPASLLFWRNQRLSLSFSPGLFGHYFCFLLPFGVSVCSKGSRKERGYISRNVVFYGPSQNSDFEGYLLIPHNFSAGKFINQFHVFVFTVDILYECYTQCLIFSFTADMGINGCVL